MAIQIQKFEYNKGINIEYTKINSFGGEDTFRIRSKEPSRPELKKTYQELHKIFYFIYPELQVEGIYALITGLSLR